MTDLRFNIDRVLARIRVLLAPVFWFEVSYHRLVRRFRRVGFRRFFVEDRKTIDQRVDLLLQNIDRDLRELQDRVEAEYAVSLCFDLVHLREYAIESWIEFGIIGEVKRIFEEIAEVRALPGLTGDNSFGLTAYRFLSKRLQPSGASDRLTLLTGLIPFVAALVFSSSPQRPVWIPSLAELLPSVVAAGTLVFVDSLIASLFQEMCLSVEKDLFLKPLWTYLPLVGLGLKLLFVGLGFLAVEGSSRGVLILSLSALVMILGAFKLMKDSNAASDEDFERGLIDTEREARESLLRALLAALSLGIYVGGALLLPVLLRLSMVLVLPLLVAHYVNIRQDYAQIAPPGGSARWILSLDASRRHRLQQAFETYESQCLLTYERMKVLRLRGLATLDFLRRIELVVPKVPVRVIFTPKPGSIANAAWMISDLRFKDDSRISKILEGKASERELHFSKSSELHGLRHNASYIDDLERSLLHALNRNWFWGWREKYLQRLAYERPGFDPYPPLEPDGTLNVIGMIRVDLTELEKVNPKLLHAFIIALGGDLDHEERFKLTRCSLYQRPTRPWAGGYLSFVG